MAFYSNETITSNITISDDDTNNTSLYYHDNNDYPGYSNVQKLILEIAPYLTAPFSIIGSLIVLYVIMKESGFKSIFYRFIFCLSILDLLSSTSILIFGPFAMPSNDYYTDIPYENPVYGAYGNFNTCEISGVLLSFFFGTVSYNVGLAIYFVGVVRYQMKEDRKIVKYVFEPIIHFFAIIAPIIGSIQSIIRKEFNPLVELPGYCLNTASFPHNCNNDNNIKCIRGEHVNDTSTAYTTFLYVLFWIVIIISMTLLILKVRETETRMSRYASGTNYQQTKETAIQALLYIGAFFITFFPIVLLQIVTKLINNADTALIFTFALLTKIFSPMQGFWNAIIFLRTRFNTLTQHNHSLEFLKPIIHRLSFRHRSSVTDPMNSGDEKGNEDQEEQSDTESPSTENNGEDNIEEC